MSKFQELLNSETPVLIDFFAEWCGPCKMMPPILKQLKNSLGDNIKIVKVDIDKNQSLASTYQVQSVPTIMLFQKSKMLWRTSGVLQAHQIEQIIKEHTK